MNNIIVGIVITSTETVLDQLEKTFCGILIQDVMDCYLKFKDVPLCVPGQVTLDICPKVIGGLYQEVIS